MLKRLMAWMMNREFNDPLQFNLQTYINEATYCGT